MRPTKAIVGVWRRAPPLVYLRERSRMRRLGKAAAWIILGLLAAALLAAAAFELVTGDGTAWGRLPAALVVLAFAGALGWFATRTAPAEQKPAPARAPDPEDLGFAG